MGHHTEQNSEAQEHRTFFPIVRPKLHRSTTHIPPPGGTKAHSIWTPQPLAWAGQPTWRLPGAPSTRGRPGLPAAYLPAPSGLLLVKSKNITSWGAEFQTNNVQRVQKCYYDVLPLLGLYSTSM